MKVHVSVVSLIVLPTCLHVGLGNAQRQEWRDVGVSKSVVAVAPAIEPVDSDLIPEARRVLEYLKSVQGKKMLSGISGSQDAQPWAVLHMTGQEPAIAGGDMAGYHRKGSPMYHKVMQHTVDKVIYWWRQKGGIVALQWHWMKPGNPEGRAWVEPPRGTGPLDLAKAITPGTEEYQAVMADLKMTAQPRWGSEGGTCVALLRGMVG